MSRPANGVLPPNASEYLRKRGSKGAWRLAGEARGDFDGVVVIPALAEEATLFATLDSLQANPPPWRDRFLVVVVVNHPSAADDDVREDNERTLRRLRQGIPGLALNWIDAASPGLELPGTGGVGAARKIGFDLALERLDWRRTPLLASLDADTLVHPGYLPAVETHFRRSPCGGAVVPFCHQPGETAEQEQAIVLYELYLRSYALGLARAGSPYGFPTVGSAFACRAEAYVRSGGMNRRPAGEDFYFLQQLAKTAGVGRIAGTVVRPSSRISSRTPFGTGRSVLRLLNGDPTAVCFHPLESFQLLATWLDMAVQQWQRPGAGVLAEATSLHPRLGDFLAESRLIELWPRLQAQYRDHQAFRAAFHGWFDGLKTRQFLYRLSRGPFPPQPPAVALPPLLAWAGLPAATDPQVQIALLRGCGNCVCRKRCNIVE